MPSNSKISQTFRIKCTSLSLSLSLSHVPTYCHITLAPKLAGSNPAEAVGFLRA